MSFGNMSSLSLKVDITYSEPSISGVDEFSAFVLLQTFSGIEHPGLCAAPEKSFLVF
jgi:hypothetical protein